MFILISRDSRSEVCCYMIKKTIMMSLFFNSGNYSYTMKGLVSSIQLVTEGTCPMFEVAWLVQGWHRFRGNQSPFWWKIAALITWICCIFGYVVNFMLNITVMTWRLIFLENILNRVNASMAIPPECAQFHLSRLMSWLPLKLSQMYFLTYYCLLFFLVV